MGGGQRQLDTGSEVAGFKNYSLLESILSVMEGVEGQEGYCSEGCGLEKVDNKCGEDCGMECEAESKPHGNANLFSLIHSSDLGIKICSEGAQLPLWCTVDRFFQPIILHSK